MKNYFVRVMDLGIVDSGVIADNEVERLVSVVHAEYGGPEMREDKNGGYFNEFNNGEVFVRIIVE